MSDRSSTLTLVVDMLRHVTKDMPIVAKVLVWTTFIERLRK